VRGGMSLPIFRNRKCSALSQAEKKEKAVWAGGKKGEGLSGVSESCRRKSRNANPCSFNRTYDTDRKGGGRAGCVIGKRYPKKKENDGWNRAGLKKNLPSDHGLRPKVSTVFSGTVERRLSSENITGKRFESVRAVKTKSFPPHCREKRKKG